MISIPLGLLILSKPHEITVRPDTVHLVFSISDLYAPFLTPTESVDVLNSLVKSVEFVATYTHTTWSFQLSAGGADGVGGLYPGWYSKRTEQKRAIPVRIVSSTYPGFRAEFPQSLDGGYVLSELYITVSPDGFYDQPSYRSLVGKITAEPSPLDRDPPPPSFEYMVDFRNRDHAQPRGDEQDCLFVLTPMNFPQISIPIVVQLTTDSKRMSLSRVMHRTCPLDGSELGDRTYVAPGHLPPSRIAAAQVNIDFDGVNDATRQSGLLPVNEGMARWFHRNKEGVYADLTTFGPFQQLWMRVRGDNAHPAYGVLPSRTEVWTFFNNELVGHSGDIYYSMSTDHQVHWHQYFHNGQSVGTKFVPTTCDEQGCRDAQAEIQSELSKPYDVLKAEALAYLKLRGALTEQ